MISFENLNVLVTLLAVALAMRVTYVARKYALAENRVHQMLEEAESYDDFSETFQDYAKSAHYLEKVALRRSLQLLLQLQYLQRRTVTNHYATLSKEDVAGLRAKGQETQQ